MDLNIRVADVMEPDLITVDIADSLVDVMAIFNEIKIRHIPVVAGGSLVGMISHTDVLKVDEVNKIVVEKVSVSDRNIPEVELRKVMAKNPVSIDKNRSLREAIEIFAKEQFHALPVTSDGNLVGMLTTTDVMRYMLKQS